MPFFKMERMVSSQQRGSLSEGAYLEAKEKVTQGSKKTLGILFEKHQLDAIVAPSRGAAWTIDVINGDHGRGSSSSPAAWSGFPSITVPAGHVHGLPIGLSFFGRAWQEKELINIAYGFERISKVRETPSFLSTIQI